MKRISRRSLFATMGSAAILPAAGVYAPTFWEIWAYDVNLRAWRHVPSGKWLTNKGLVEDLREDLRRSA